VRSSIFNTVFDGEPMELLKNRSDMFYGRSSGNDTGGCILDQLELKQRFMRKTRENGVTVVDTGCNEGMDENGGAVGCE